MTRQNTKSKKGFTIIEVVLVLAIAGLIFLMVFIAFPALQRSQHDTQRTDDMARVQAALINWQNNHSNHLPAATPTGTVSDATTVKLEFNTNDATVFDASTGAFLNCGTNQACQFVRDYMNAAATATSGSTNVINTFKDPDGEFYNLVITSNIATNTGLALEGINFVNTAYNSAKMTIKGDADGGYTIEGQRDAYAMFIIPGATCNEDRAIRSTKNNFAVLYQTEGSGVKCINNGS